MGRGKRGTGARERGAPKEDTKYKTHEVEKQREDVRPSQPTAMHADFVLNGVDELLHGIMRTHLRLEVAALVFALGFLVVQLYSVHYDVIQYDHRSIFLLIFWLVVQAFQQLPPYSIQISPISMMAAYSLVLLHGVYLVSSVLDKYSFIQTLIVSIPLCLKWITGLIASKLSVRGTKKAKNGATVVGERGPSGVGRCRLPRHPVLRRCPVAVHEMIVDMLLAGVTAVAQTVVATILPVVMFGQQGEFGYLGRSVMVSILCFGSLCCLRMGFLLSIWRSELLVLRKTSSRSLLEEVRKSAKEDSHAANPGSTSSINDSESGHVGQNGEIGDRKDGPGAGKGRKGKGKKGSTSADVGEGPTAVPSRVGASSAADGVGGPETGGAGDSGGGGQDASGQQHRLHQKLPAPVETWMDSAGMCLLRNFEAAHETLVVVQLLLSIVALAAACSIAFLGFESAPVSPLSESFDSTASSVLHSSSADAASATLSPSPSLSGPPGAASSILLAEVPATAVIDNTAAVHSWNVFAPVSALQLIITLVIAKGMSKARRGYSAVGGVTSDDLLSEFPFLAGDAHEPTSVSVRE
eukprot:Rmarinus@m.24878